MSKIAAFLWIAGTLLVTSCSKTDLPPENYDPEQWMQTHQRAEVAYVDYFSGNYIVQTSQGFAVIENWSGYTPREGNMLYAHFQFTGMQTIYNRNGNYFTNGKIVANWLSYFEAMNILNQIGTQ